MTLCTTQFVPVNDVTKLLVIFISHPTRVFSANRLKYEHDIADPYDSLLQLYFAGLIKIQRKEYAYSQFRLSVPKSYAVASFFKLNTKPYDKTSISINP